MPSIISSDRLQQYEEAQRELMILREQHKEVLGEHIKLNQRVKDVENAYTEKTGLQIRNDVTRVFTKFTKVEMITMMAGVYSIMKSSHNTDDITMYTQLIQKLQGFIDKMEDDDGNTER